MRSSLFLSLATLVTTQTGPFGFIRTKSATTRTKTATRNGKSIEIPRSWERRSRKTNAALGKDIGDKDKCGDTEDNG